MFWWFFFWKSFFEKYFFISKKKSFVQNNKMMLPKTTKRTCVSTAAETWCKMDDSQEMITWIWKTPLTLHQVCVFHNKTTPLPTLQQKNDNALLTQHHAARRMSFGKKSFENENASGLLENCYNFLGPCRNITSCETKAYLNWLSWRCLLSVDVLLAEWFRACVTTFLQWNM